MQDLRSGTRFAKGRANPVGFSYPICRYDRPLICYPGQKARFASKLRNVELAIESIDRLLIQPGETFSFWRCVGRPTRSAGYEPAAALRNQVLTEDVGGAICLVSTLLYNVGLLSGMTIIERRCHSVDSYSDARYFELGRDASVEFAYIDLRYRNDFDVPLMLRAWVTNHTVIGEAWSPTPLALMVAIEVDTPRYEPAPDITTSDPTLEPGSCIVDDPGLPGVRAHTWRTIVLDGTSHTEDIGVSVHSAQPRCQRIGPDPGANIGRSSHPYPLLQ